MPPSSSGAGVVEGHGSRSPNCITRPTCLQARATQFAFANGFGAATVGP